MNVRISRRAGLLTLAAIAAACWGLSALPPAADAGGKGDADKLDGKWTAMSMTQRGKKVTDEIQVLVFEFKGDQLTLSFPGKSKGGSFKTDPSKSPKQFEMQLEGEPGAAPGIYKIEKDTLTLCFSGGPNPERPKQFEAPDGSRNVLLVLKRGEVKLTDEQKKKALADKIQMAAQKTISQNNLHQIGIAMHNYHDTYKRLPLHAIYSKDRKPLLSWRVTILPYIEEQALYQQFKLDEPWDSEHNKKLLEKMPKIYAPVRGQTKEPHSTFYQVFVGKGTAFEDNKKLRLLDFRDGTSNTLLVVEAGEAVPWTKPADLPYQAKKDLPPLGGHFKDGFYIALADGSVRWIRRPFDASIFHLLITRADGQPIDWDKLER